MDTKKIAVVGAGPAGMMAAIRAAECGAQVILIEKNPSPGRKLLLSGKGRCNLTNACELEDFIERFSGNGQFLRDAFKHFFYPELMKFFEDRALALKVERQSRVFPASGTSSDVLYVLEKELAKNKINIMFNSPLKDIIVDAGKARGLVLSSGTSIMADKIVLATGGVSFSFTGSTGEGIGLAKKLGHKHERLRPALVPLVTKEKFVKEIMGLTLKNIRLTFKSQKKQVESEIGEMIFTDFGISGPLVLTHSGMIARWLEHDKNVFVEIDLKPGLDEEKLDARILREIAANPKKGIKNVLKELLPLKLIAISLRILKIDPDKKVSHLSQQERKAFVSFLKAFRLDISSTKPIEEGMVTQGGVSLKDIDPRTMQSRVIKGLYFAGEMIDIDADTGGFNLQAAFSTGYLAGESAAKDK